MKVTWAWRSVKPELVPLCIGLVWDTTSKKLYPGVPHVPSKSLPREPLISHGIPQRPWSKLGMDIFTFNGKGYLLIVDYYSKYLEVSHLATKTTACVISHLKTCFARHGIPDTVIADNMPLEVSSLLSWLVHGVLKLRHQVLTMLHQMDKVRGQLEQ